MSGRNVLLVDDTPEIAELLTFALRDRGYLVTAEGYDPSIVDRLAEQHADAVVLNCSLLDMSLSLFDAVRDHPDHRALPIVIVSDTPEKADASLRAREADHVLLIPKPFTASHIARALDQLLSDTVS